MADIIKTLDLPITPGGLRRFARIYRNSVSARNSNNMFTVAYQWQDKPHRHVYSLCARLEAAAEEIERLRKEDRP